jgi:hypothetical protein
MNENGEVVTTEPDTAVLLGLRKATNPFEPVTMPLNLFVLFATDYPDYLSVESLYGLV